MKRLFLALIWYSGLLHLLLFVNRKKVTILMLHGVAAAHPESKWSPLWPRITPATLDRVLSQLGRYYNFVSLDDAVAMLAGDQPSRDNSIVITFDDGYRNNVTEALPILRKYDIPATFFVATGFVETGRSYWIDRLDFALQAAPESARYIEIEEFNFDLRNRNRAELQEDYRKLRLMVKMGCNDDRKMLSIFDFIASSLESAAGKSIDAVLDDDPFVAVASWRELREARSAGVTIGSHSVNHYRLDSVELPVADLELTQSKSDIEERLGEDCTFFCYPNGSFNEAVVERTRNAGYKAAVTTQNGLNSAGENLYTLKRFAFPVKNTTAEVMLAISGLRDATLVRSLFGRHS
jgi:peptidoglycan/xylan/chitin deacetylase (PgdA/CDA1 family)